MRSGRPRSVRRRKATKRVQHKMNPKQRGAARMRAHARRRKGR